MHLTRMNILPPNSTLDDVLALETESILSRRLQTLAYLKGLANTPVQARQLISHGHIAIGGRKITVPSYMVTKDEESDIGYGTDSPLNDLLHPTRPHADFKSVPIKKEKEPEKLKEEKPSSEKKAQKKEESSERPKKETGEPEKQVEKPTDSEGEAEEEKTGEEKIEVEDKSDAKEGGK